MITLEENMKVDFVIIQFNFINSYIYEIVAVFIYGKNTENIKLILSKINYPDIIGYLVSFGIVKDIRLVDDIVYLSLSVKTNDGNNKKIIEKMKLEIVYQKNLIFQI